MVHTFGKEGFPIFPDLHDKPTRWVHEVEKESPKEKVPSIIDLHRYLQETGRKHLCENLFSCDPWRVEPSLLHELNGLRQRLTEHGDALAQKELNRLRALMRVGSFMHYKRVSDAEALTKVDSELRLKDPRWHNIEHVFQNQLLGEEIEPAVRDIEDLYGIRMFQWITGDEKTRRSLHAEIEKIRIIRDKLYLRRLHPKLAQQASETVTIFRRK